MATIFKFGKTDTGVAHCPCSNMRLGSGIVPIRKMLNHNVPVGLGGDGSASNDAGNMLQSARTAFLLARVGSCDALVMLARDILKVATVGGAKVLGRDDIGKPAPGMSADLGTINLDRPQFAGALQDTVAAVIFCQTNHVDYSFINGKKFVDQGRLTTLKIEPLVKKANQLSQQLCEP
ncbi:MAG: amidohydrolase family protein [Limnothrix sp. RL_2_0]|nr:amidohydrolase family protein [Limnothrix sp. RL_2_0]